MSDDENKKTCSKDRQKSVRNRRKLSEPSKNVSLPKHSNQIVTKKKELVNEQTINSLPEDFSEQMDYSLRRFTQANKDVSTKFRSDICFRRSTNSVGVEIECVKQILREQNVIRNPTSSSDTNFIMSPGSNVFDNQSEVEMSKRLVCEKLVQELQEKLLKSEQEMASVKLKYHQTEKQLVELQEVLKEVSKSWQKMEDTINHLHDENLRNQAQLTEVNQMNGVLHEKLTICENQRVTFQKLSDQTSLSTNMRITHLEKLEETLQRRLATEQESGIKYQEDLQNLRKQLFDLQQEIQDLSRSKLEQERELSVEVNATRQALEEEKRSRQSLAAENDRLREQLTELSSKCKAMQQVQNRTQEEKNSVVIEFRQAEAKKIAQEYEHAASLQKVVNQLQRDLDLKVQDLQQAHKVELQQVLAVAQSHLDSMKNNHQVETEKTRQLFAELLLQKDKHLEDLSTENQSLLQKFEELENGRSQLLSKLQIHLQNQWIDAVDILYSVSNPTIEAKEIKCLSPPKIQISNFDTVSQSTKAQMPERSNIKLDDPIKLSCFMDLPFIKATPHSIPSSKMMSKFSPSPIQTSSTPLPSEGSSKALSRLSHSGFTLSPTLQLEDFGISHLSPVVCGTNADDPSKKQANLDGSYAGSKHRKDVNQLVGIKDTQQTGTKSHFIDKLNLDEQESSITKEEPEGCPFNERSQKLQHYINKLLQHSPSSCSPTISTEGTMSQVLTPEKD